jgi:hypothetical protein
MHLLIKWKPSNPFAHSYLARLHCSLHQHQAFFLLLHHPPLCSKENEPVIIWNPQFVQSALPTLNVNTDNIYSNHNTPAIVKDAGNNDNPVPSQCTQSPCHQLIRPLQNHPLARNQFRLHSAHMTDCVTPEELMPTPALCTCPPSLYCGYAFVAECILLETISPPSHSTVHFIGAIIDNNKGNVLGYRHLMKMDKQKKAWAHSFFNE